MSSVSFFAVQRVLLASTLLACCIQFAGPSRPASAALISDPLGDFLPTYTGAHDAGLDVLTHEVTLVGDRLNFFGRMAGPIAPTQAVGGLYLIGVDRGLGTTRFLNSPAAPPIIGPNVKWDAIVRILPDGTGFYLNSILGVTTPLSTSDISVIGNEFNVSIPVSLMLPSATKPPAEWTYNLWPRNGVGLNVQVSDLAPDDGNSRVHSVPEPASLSILALAVPALLLRRKRARTENGCERIWMMLVSHSHRFLRAVVAIVAVGWLASAAGATTNVYGGPTYDSTTQTGYHLTSNNALAGDGAAAGAFSKFDMGVAIGDRAVRWDASGTVATELGNLGTDSSGVTYSRLNDINTAGTAVGYSNKYVLGINKGVCAVRWDASGTTATELGNLGTDGNGAGLFNMALAVNTATTAVGYAQDVPGLFTGQRAVRWDASGTATELGNLGVFSNGFTFSQANAINTPGTAVGYAEKYVSGVHKGSRAVRWDASGTAATELGNLGTDSSGATTSDAIAINTAGMTVGEADKYDAGIDKGIRAVRWDASGMATELGNLGTDSAGITGSVPYAINTAGTVVGVAHRYDAGIDKGERAVRWDASGTVATELGNLGTDSTGFTEGRPIAINTAGVAVGLSNYYDSNGSFPIWHAVAWGLDGVAIDLNSLLDPGSGWVNLSAATSISDTNWVVGVGTFDPGNGQLAYARAFLLDINSAIPEPTSLSILALAVPALLLRRKRSFLIGPVDRLTNHRCV